MNTNEIVTTVLFGNDYFEKCCEIFRKAERTIDICSFDWRHYSLLPACTVSLFNKELLSAQARGVRVRCYVQGEANARPLATLGLKVHNVISRKLLHAKVVLVDDTVAIIGSHNITQHGFTSNIEVSVLCDVTLDSERLRNYFDHLWQI